MVTGKNYGVILADPPWRFRTWTDTNDAKSARRHYSLMEIDEISALPVAEWAAPNCALFIWATWPTIFQTEGVIKSWGFRYSGLAWEWLKYNPKTRKYAFGLGYGTRKNLEPCLLALRGKPKLKARNVRDFLFAPRREHSRKPDEQYESIEAMYDGPYLEMFSRTTRPGWDAWGNEVGKFANDNNNAITQEAA
jgi:N6-adenosine-specific RNA methylase IME4